LIFEGIAFENDKNKENPILVTSTRGRSLFEVGCGKLGGKPFKKTRLSQLFLLRFLRDLRGKF
jgi:hypothetical protein